MQISLDYYRILGIPLQAELNLIEQAYQDRIIQLPHTGYTEYAITSRNNLLQKAYNVLKDNQSRLDYELSFLPLEVENEDIIEEIEDKEKLLGVSNENLAIVEDTVIDIDESLFIGALIILLELGEYELILTLTQPYLQDKDSINHFTNREEEITDVWQDLILTVILAYLELAREQWQQKQYESASNSLSESYNLLFKQNLFSHLRVEIKQDLGKLRPYQILELLTRENNDSYSRQKGIKLLKEMLNSRGGIESQTIDDSGLDIESFLRFIQQIRVYLTPEEQQILFEEEAQRPSPAAGYLAAYAGIARGFIERRPEFIIRAKNSLISLTIHQDVYLEQSICALLLGQTAEAEFSLSQSREKKVIDYIQEMSQGSPDLLPGLCIYTEEWLEKEVFPQFKNVGKQNSSLKEYFANDRVQGYLEKISTPLNSDLQDNEPSLSVELELPYSHQLDSKKSYSFTEFNALKDQTDYEEQIINNTYQESHSTTNGNFSEELEKENISLLSDHHQQEEDLIGFDDFLSAEIEEENVSDVSHGDIRKNIASDMESDSVVMDNTVVTKKVNTFSKDNNNVVILSLLGLLLLLVAVGFGAVKLLLSPKSSENKLQISITEPLIELPNNENSHQDKSKLDKNTALIIINQWLNAKAKATGPEYSTDELRKILTEPQLSIWVGNSRDLRTKNAYRRYEHSAKIESAQVNPQDTSQGMITAKISEKSQHYRNGALVPSLSYQDNLLVRYELINNGDGWLIKSSKVIK